MYQSKEKIFRASGDPKEVRYHLAPLIVQGTRKKEHR